MTCQICQNPIERADEGFCHCNIGQVHYDCLTPEIIQAKADPETAGIMCDGS